MAELILALDFPDKETSLQSLRILGNRVKWVKAGLRLFVSEGPEFIVLLKKMGYRVFLDLKFYDIPNTVADAVKSAQKIGADMLTLHLQGGRRMCAAARDALSKKELPYLMGVTVLTSFASGEMPGIQKEPGEFANELADNAAEWKMSGVVCSGWEAAAIKKVHPELLCVCPGIRLPGDDGSDQRRIMTPQAAVKAGADFLVAGRSITKAKNPKDAVENILELMNLAS